jgi:HK97 gp10 family phage protein
MKIEFIGAGKVRAAMEKVKRQIRNDANKLVAGAAMRTATVAKQRLQPHSGDSREQAFEIAAIRQSINYSHNANALEATVYAGNVTGDHLAAYYEFGTGKHAATYVPGLPPGWQALARTFYVNGKGTLKEHPYLYPAWKQEGQRLSEKLKNLKVSW